jgi:precorrin-6Y C5,15-methyltransferase (decarboxylating)
MQGPFNEDINYGMMRQFDIKYLVTKDSGEPGGFDEKMRAAARAGVGVILVGRPPEDGASYDDVVKEMSKRFCLTMKRKGSGRKKRTIWVIGAGMGDPNGMTIEAAEACRNADLVIGPKRVIGPIGAGKNILEEFNHEKIITYIREHPEFNDIAAVFSGDIGFYSGARKLIENADREWNVVPICGISSVAYLCSKLGIPWQDAHLMSAHGRGSNIVGAVRTHEKVFCLLSKGTDITELCKKMVSYGMNDVNITIGERLGYPDERITAGRPQDISDTEFGDLSVILAVNGNPDTECPISIPDQEFIRGDVPMTKSEVRALTVGKLKLKKDSVIYDVGAGTGSVSVEMAKVAVNGTVYAIETEKDALELILKNKMRFGADNIEIIDGKAPGALIGLPAPTHAFIGGSGGSLMEIMKVIKEKSPDAVMIVNSVTMETAYDVLRCIKDLGLEEIETLCISISKARATERSHLMVAQNPIYMTVCRGRGK